MKKKVASFLMCAVLLVGHVLTGCGTKEEKTINTVTEDKSNTASSAETDSGDLDFSKLKVAFILPGSANDGGFNTKGYNAMLHLQDLGCETAYSERVTADQQLTAIRDYAGIGYDIIVGWGSQNNDDMAKVAEEFPEIQFIVASGTVGNDVNLTSIEISGSHLGYGYGYLSALATKTNKVALICGQQGNQTDTDEVAAFIEAAKICNPDIEVNILYVADPSDVSEAKEAAKLCMERGCDVMFGEIFEGYKGVFDICRENGLMTFARTAAHIEAYPEGCIAYIENAWGLKMEDVVSNYLENGLVNGVISCGFGTVVRGWEYIYDEEHTVNPDLISEDQLAEFQKNVIDKISSEGYDPVFTAEDANPGTY